MLYLHNNTSDALGESIKDYLMEISAAFKTVEMSNEESFIRENEKLIKGKVNIFQYLDVLKRDLEDERLLSADACIMNPRDGEIC